MTVGANSFAQNTVLHKQVRMNSHLQFQLQKSFRRVNATGDLLTGQLKKIPLDNDRVDQTQWIHRRPC